MVDGFEWGKTLEILAVRRLVKFSVFYLARLGGWGLDEH